MIITFIGMSNVGKSAWSKKLEKLKGFKRYCCDDLIEKYLGPELKALGYAGIENVSRWMGQPYNQRFKKNSQRYLELEAKSLKDSLEEINRLKDNINVVIDTTGSVVYMPKKILNILTTRTKIVYLEAPVGMMKAIIKKYIDKPKPVIWGDLYQPLAGEDKNETLKRCYLKLLKYRTNLYEKLGAIKINDITRTKKDFTVENLLELINFEK
ncbi:hypothetical protein HY750_00075 [Candidatus Kuenenbacteria bacterium]|nr:hypothetical protein [Candidatus Kuenenbacteria bacterium]